MTILERIKSQSRINVDEVIERLTKEFKVMSNEGKEQVNFALYSTLQLILNTTNRDYLIEDMYSLWVDMTKDYWYLNGYDKQYNSNNTSTEEQSSNADVKIKSIKRGDTETTFVETKNQTTINGVTYQTGTINFDEDTLTKKYIKRLYKFRKLGRRRW
nr:MAG TPA: tail connector protein [Caudoviricetes sp.]